MSYLSVISFDLKNADSDDYKNAYSDLENIGFSRFIISDKNNMITLPTTTCAGEFQGSSASELRSNLCEIVKNKFKARNLTSDIFISVGGDWSCGHRTT